MAIPLNPYVAGNPVGDSPAFVGRADVLREVLRVLRRPQDNAIVLYGQRRIGKTSILQHLAAWLPREGTYRPVLLDLEYKAEWSLGRVLEDLARAIAHTLGQPDPDLGPNPETSFRQKWLPAVLGDLPEASSLVLLFDEFDVLADPKAEQAAAAFFPYLRNLLTLGPQRLQFVFVIGRNVDDLDNIALSLFKGTPAWRVSLLSREDTADLVRLSEKNGTLTSARFLLGLYLIWLGLRGGPEAVAAAALTLLVAWVTDVLDGPLARRDPRDIQTWIGDHDLEADVTVALGVWAYLALAGFLSLWLAVAYVVAAAAALWHFGSIHLAWGVQALPYGAMIWTAWRTVPSYGLLLVVWIGFVLVATWPRFPQQTLPEFLGGMRDLLRRP